MSVFEPQGYGPPRRRMGCNPRLLIGVVIALFAIVTYYSRTSINPTTGEKQHVTLTVDEETRLGLQSAPEMARQMGGEINPSHPAAQLVRAVGQKVWQNSDAKKSPYQFDFHLLADPQTVNAFALPGGQVFITKGLLDQLNNEAQLAGVLGHEIGHVIGRHAAEHMAKADLGNMLVVATGVAASDDRRGGNQAMMIAAVVNNVAQMKFSRSDESESDAFGLKFMVQSGYDPRAMLEVMEILKRASGSRGGASIFQTHPNPDQRIIDIKAWLEKNYPNGVPSTLSEGRSLR